jgi:hypothetical protein
MFSVEFSTRDATADLVMHTNSYHELAAQDPNAARSYWESVQRMYGNLGYEPAEFTYMSWVVDESLRRFNTEIEELVHDGQEA